MSRTTNTKGAKIITLGLGAFLLCSVVFAFLFHLFSQSRRETLAPALPRLGTLDLDRFTFTDQAGERFPLARLRGETWLAAFIFTRCASSCPMMTAQMARLQEMTRSIDRLHFVSFTVDPAHDTPDALARYARQYGADRARWILLTGEKASIYTLARKGFKLGVETDEEAESLQEAFLHSNRFVLVDWEGRVRAYYDSSEPNITKKVMADIERLRGEGR